MNNKCAVMIAVLFSAGSGIAIAQDSSAPMEKTTEMTAEISEKYQFPAAGEAPVVTSVDEIKSMTTGHGSELLVVNFWATFCGPCVEEIPYFVALAEDHQPEEVRVVGISVDLRRDVETRVIPFLRDRAIPYPNMVLFGDQQETIEFFSETWSGELPATFFFDKNGKKLGEVLGPLTKEQLTEKVSEMQEKIG